MLNINLTLRRRILLIFFPVIILMGLMGGIIVRRINTMNVLIQENYNDGLVNIELLGETISEALRVRERLLLLHTSESLTEQQRQNGIMIQHEAQVRALIEEYVENEEEGEFTEVDVGGAELVDEFNVAWNDYVASGEEVAQLTISGERAQANIVLTGDAQHKLDHAIALLLLLQDIEDNAALENFVESQNLYLDSRNLMATLTIAAIVIGLGLAYWLARTTSARLADLSETAVAIANGDFDQRANVTGQDEIGVLGQAFNSMTAQLRESIGSLEQRVFERTRALQTSTEVARRLSTILDQDQLLLEVVEQVQTAFDYYHAQIYISDEKSGNLVLTGGTGDAGRTMLAQNHQIKMGQGLVGRAAETRVTLLAPDVSLEPGWLPNPLLPETKAEIAIPIELGDQLLGVLDIQHNIAGALTETDAELLQSVASQVAVALRNANLYAETQHRAVRETMINEINQRIRSTKDVNEALQIAVRELGRAVGAPKTAVRLMPGESSNGKAEENGNE